MAKFEIIWDAPEFEYREKQISWYWISIIVAAIIIAFSVWQRNFLFGFFIVVAEMLFIVWGNRAPRIVTFTLSENELTINGNKSYLLKEFESWSVNIGGGEDIELAFYFKSKLRPSLMVIAPDERLNDIRTNLKGILKEVEHDPTLIESIEKFLRF